MITKNSRFQELLKGEDNGQGRSVIFTITPEMRQKVRLEKLEKRAKKKEKRLTVMASYAKKSLQEQEQLIKKTKDLFISTPSKSWFSEN
jgi:hypothetical protein